MSVQAIAWAPSGAVRIVDQLALPEDYTTRDLESVAAVADAIQHLQVRGAPLIGIAAAMGLVAGLRDDRALARGPFLAKLEAHAALLADLPAHRAILFPDRRRLGLKAIWEE